MSARLNARQLVDLVLDVRSFVSWDSPVTDPPTTEAYASQLAEARLRTGHDESVVTGEGLVGGRRVAVILGEFSFLGGSIGVAAAERLVCAIERATEQRLPLLAAPVSGGTRMQEGTVAFVQMVKITAAINAHKARALPYLVYLRHPTTGGVLASWGSMGHVTVAEPRALVGFLGPRVYEVLHGKPFPAGVQLSENLFACGVVDAVVAPSDIREVLERALNVLCADKTPRMSPDVPELTPLSGASAWESVSRSRHDGRPGVRELLRYAARDVVLLNGTGQGEREPGVHVSLARFGQTPCVFVGQDRSTQSRDRSIGPGALRAARRGMRLAAELHLPLVTAIDTRGAALSVEAEEGGLAGEIARCLSDLVALPTPTLTLILGQGAGGAALALLPADRVIAAEHGWLAPLPPEGASAIVYRSMTHAAEMAEIQGLRSLALMERGIVDTVVPEHLDASENPQSFCEGLGGVLECELEALLRLDDTKRLRRRFERFRNFGAP